MNPGNSRILICPFCGKKKEIMSLLSGNTFGAEMWSDNKQIAPMLPEISYVQRCPQCGKYYITERQELKYAKDSYSFDKGLLSYPEMKEAFIQLSEEGFVNEEEETKVRMMLHHAYNDYYYRSYDNNEIETKVRMMLHLAYNDYYYRSYDNKEINAEDKTLFHENGSWLIDNLITDNVLKAEFYREIGEFEVAHDILESVEVEDEFLKRIMTQIQERLQNNDCRVFKIQ